MTVMVHPRPEDMRAAMADYVAGVHAAYARAAQTYPPAAQGRLEMLRRPFTVAAAGSRNLHVIAAGDQLAAPRGPEVSSRHSQDGMEWTLRFLDPVVLPALAAAEGDAPDPAAVRRVIGIGRHHYHLVVRPGSDLTAHHATHTGTGLANAHLAADRDYESLRALASADQGLVDELAAADAAGLTRAHGLLACALAPWSGPVRDASASGDRKEVRRALLAALRGGR